MTHLFDPNRKRPFGSRLVVLLAAAMGIAVAAPSQAKASEPRQLIEDMLDDAMQVLRSDDLQGANERQQRMSRLRDIANRHFDWDHMSRSSLGHHWRDLAADQQDQFVDIFKRLLADQYLDDIDQFQGDEQVRVDSVEREGENAIVKTTLVTHSRDQVPIHYHLHPEGDEWRIHDVTVEGVSLVNHYRGTLGRFLVNNSFDQLIQRLRRKAGQGGEAG